MDVLTILVTNRCPLECDHCGPKSGPKEKGHLTIDDVIAAIDEAKAHGSMVVNFSGGEPFLIGDSLIEMIKEASIRNFITRVVTGCYWSSTTEKARKALTPFAEAGLNQLFVSCGDAHQRFVPLTNILNATAVANEMNISAYVSIEKAKNSIINTKTVRELFESANVRIPWLIESHVVPYGRGANYIDDQLVLREITELEGGCPAMTKHIAIHSNRNVTGCTSVFSGTCSSLIFGNLSTNRFESILEKINSNPLALMIHKDGPIAIKKIVEKNSSIKFNDKYVNICHLCGDILGNTDAVQILNKHLNLTNSDSIS